MLRPLMVGESRPPPRNENLSGGQDDSLAETRSERHGFGRLTKNQLTGFMVGTMKGFMVNEAEFAGSTPILALSASARAKNQLKGFMVGTMNPFMVHSGVDGGAGAG